MGKKRYVLNHRDINQLAMIGKTQSETELELELIRSGVPLIRLHGNCGYGDGITTLTREQQLVCTGTYEKAMSRGSFVKFVAASGAASRMFRGPLHCLNRGWTTHKLLIERIADGNAYADECLQFIVNLPGFAFYDRLKSLMASKGLDLPEIIESREYRAVLENVLTEQGLNYGTQPKCLIPFHQYPDRARTAFEEHLVENTAYLVDRNRVTRIHFTVSPESEAKVKEHFKEVLSRLEPMGIRFDVTFSIQEPSTDTAVLDCGNVPLRDHSGNLVLYPSGHGALLPNLNALGGDFVFVRTVDNILPDRYREMVCFHKKVLGGYLVQLQEELFDSLRILSDEGPNASRLEQIERFAKGKLNLRLPKAYKGMPLAEKSRTLFQKLNVPLRVCGMVKNKSYAGGKPFWVLGEDGSETLQIVESAQVDMGDEAQRIIWDSCEFFNPVDIVCGVRDYRGESFNLSEFSNPSLGFVSTKVYGGSECRVLERPGLWNGSMAYWNTVFLEVPAATLRPVKNILSLLS